MFVCFGDPPVDQNFDGWERVSGSGKTRNPNGWVVVFGSAHVAKKWDKIRIQKWYSWIWTTRANLIRENDGIGSESTNDVATRRLQYSDHKEYYSL